MEKNGILLLHVIFKMVKKAQQRYRVYFFRPTPLNNLSLAICAIRP